MGNVFRNYKSNNELLLPVKTYEIDINNDKNKIRMLVGDQPIVYLKEDKYELPKEVDEKEFNIVLADAYLMGII